MTVSDAAVRAAEQARSSVPAPRPAPQEERPHRRHEGYYWDVIVADWRPCPGR